MRRRKDPGPRQSIKIRRGDTTFEWEGDLFYWNESRNILEVVTGMINLTFGKGVEPSGLQEEATADPKAASFNEADGNPEEAALRQESHP